MAPLSENKTDSQPQRCGPIKLTYALPAEGEHSAWSLLGCILSVLLMGLVALTTRDIWSTIRFGGFTIIHIHPTEFGLALMPLSCCAIGLRRGKRMLAILGIIITLATLIFAFIAATGSPWGSLPAIGCCAVRYSHLWVDTPCVTIHPWTSNGAKPIHPFPIRPHTMMCGSSRFCAIEMSTARVANTSCAGWSHRDALSVGSGCALESEPMSRV